MSGRDEQQDRNARLAEALRENLRRRKAQARGRRDQDGREPEPESASEIDVEQVAGDGPRD